ncbi:hypothetical protein Tco_1447711 [Tanacetum coccineum]
MSDSEDSTVSYVAVSNPFEGLSDIGSPEVDGPPIMPEDPYAYVVAAFQAPPSPNYVPGPEEPEQAPLSPEFVPEPVYLEFMPPEDDVFPAEEQPLPTVVSPTTDSPRYIANSNPEEDEEDLKEDPEEDPTDYPADGGDDDDDDDESSNDNEDNDDDVEEDEDEEEEHLALADTVLPPVHRVTARMSVRAQTPISLLSDTKVSRLLAIPTPPRSPLSPLSSPLPLILSSLPPILSPLPQILSPPLPVSSLPLPASHTYPLGYRAAMIRLRAETPYTSYPLPSSTPPSGTPPLLPIPLPTPSPPMLLPSTICRAGVSEGTPTVTNVAELNHRMTDFVMTVRQDTYEIYGRLDNAHDDRLCDIRDLIRNWKLRFEHSGGLLAGIHGLFSERYCGLDRRVTCGYKWPGLLVMPSYFHKKFHWGTVFATGCRSFIEPGLGHRMKRTNRRTHVLISLYPCRIEEKMTIKEVRGESVMEWKTKVTTKEGTVIKFPGKFHGYKLATEEEVEENEGLKEV